MLVEAPDNRRAIFEQTIALEIGLLVVATSARGQADELDRSPGEGAGHVPAKLDERVAEMLDKAVVSLRIAAGRDPVALRKVEPARLPPRVQAVGIIRRALQRPTARKIGVAVEIAIELAPKLDLLAGLQVGQRVRSLLQLPVPARPRRQIEGRLAAPDHGRTRDIGVYIARVPALG